MNLDEFAGISRSLLMREAKTPSAKKSRAGFFKFSNSKSVFMSCYGLQKLHVPGSAKLRSFGYIIRELK